MSSFNNLPRPFFVLAPMDDVTDTVFRQIVAECAAPDLFFTEFTNVDGLQSPGRPKLLRKLKFVKSETSLIAHIWGLKPENFYKTTREIASGQLARELGLPRGCNFVGIDLNMGCPAKSEVKSGACSALINNRQLASEIIKATQKGANGKLPVSVKTRLGFSEVDMSWTEFLLKHDLAMLTMHGRTRKQMSKVPANWDLIGKVSKLRDTISPKTLIVGNGDVTSRSQGLELAKKYNLEGIMIARGIFQNPYIFCKDGSCKWEKCGVVSRIELFKRHVELFDKTWQDGERNIQTLNKFCKIYISGFDGAKELREQLMAASDASVLLALLEKAKR
ncbi:MAG: tRNA dihydrouridine synthase [Candidatus Saccharimonadales bacterium]